MGDNLRQQLAILPELFGQHIVISATALLLGVLISVPLSLMVARSRARWAVLAVAGVIQTIPGLALLALMVPLLGAFGFWPALAALVLYSVLPILRNTVTGIVGVDPAVVEAAVAMGMTRRQVLRRVELPLALPVIVAGIRTATVWVVGVTTLSTPVGQPSLGNYLFAGLQTRNWTAVLVGCVAAASLAVALDLLLGALESGMVTRNVARRRSAAAGLVAVVVAGLVAPQLAEVGQASSAPTAAVSGDSSQRAKGETGASSARKLASTQTGTAPPPSASDAARANPPVGSIVVGSKTFTEQYILASLIQQRLQTAGLSVERRDSLGSTVAFDALYNGDIDVYVDYSGTIWANYMKRTQTPASWRVIAEASGWLSEEHGIRLLGALGFENTYALAMRAQQASALGIGSIADLSARAAELSLGSDYEFFQRPEWAKLRDMYALRFKRRVSFDASFMYAAVQRGEVDVITAFSSDGRIEAFNLRVLKDERHAFPPYDAVLLLSQRAAAQTAVLEALSPLLGHISVQHMRQANAQVDREDSKQTPEQAARWLWKVSTSGGPE